MDRNRLPREALKYRPKGRGTLDDRRRDGGTNSTLRTKGQGTHLTLNEHDDDDDVLSIVMHHSGDCHKSGRNMEQA